MTPVLRALRKNGIDVVAIHHHMTQDRPMIIFLHGGLAVESRPVSPHGVC